MIIYLICGRNEKKKNIKLRDHYQELTKLFSQF